MLCTRLALRSLTRFSLFLMVMSFLAVSLTGCLGAADPPATPTAVPTATRVPDPPTDTPLPIPTATPTIASTPTSTPIPQADRGFVPVLCYHHIRDWVKSDTEDDRAYIVPPAKLEEELKYLKDNGYTGVTARQVWDYYANGAALPSKPVALTFDDNDDNQYSNAVPLLKQYGFTATFFIMTVSLDRENYMTSDQVKALDTQGFDVEPHTWDHHMVTQYKTDEDWQKQIVGPKKTLEDLLGHETPLFAYPFGVYDAASAEKIKSYGYEGAFRLRELMDDKADPLFAIKRYIANSYWTMDQFQQALTGDW